MKNEKRQTMKMSIGTRYVKREILLACVILCEMVNSCRMFKWCLHLYVYWGNNSQKNCPIQSFSDLIKNFLNDFMSSTLSLWLIVFIRDTRRSRRMFQFQFISFFSISFYFFCLTYLNSKLHIAHRTPPTTRKNNNLNDEKIERKKIICNSFYWNAINVTSLQPNAQHSIQFIKNLIEKIELPS